MSKSQQRHGVCPGGEYCIDEEGALFQLEFLQEDLVFPHCEQACLFTLNGSGRGLVPFSFKNDLS